MSVAAKKKDQWCGCCPCRSHAYREDEGGQKIEAANADVWSSLAAPFITTAHFGRQHESGADIGLGGFGGTVARTGDLLHCALAGTILATISIAPDLASRSFSCAKLHHHNDKRSIFSVAFAAHSKFRNGRNN